jgi:16S rRNA (cytidine1402-2'-O)-methyltransferase
MAGTLSLVSTPIGNLEDITLRAIRTIKEVDIVACEDTRTTGNMLNLLGIHAQKLLSYHAHSSGDREDYIVSLLLEGQNIALVSDAGTPGISDPAYALVRKAIAAGIVITPIPGASALLAGLVCSGLPTHHFMYLGFLPVKKWRQTLLRTLPDIDMTVVIYESVHRIERTIADLAGVLGDDREIVMGREITKKFESFARGPLGDFASGVVHYEKKGEFVLAIAPITWKVREDMGE